MPRYQATYDRTITIYDGGAFLHGAEKDDIRINYTAKNKKEAREKAEELGCQERDKLLPGSSVKLTGIVELGNEIFSA